MAGLILRKVTGHPQAPNAYRVVYDGFEVGSIGHQRAAHGREFWSWGIDTPALLGRLPFNLQGEAQDLEDAMARFKATWEVLASDPQRLAKFLEPLTRKPRDK